MQEYGTSVVQELYEDCRRIDLVTSAMELLRKGYPLDDNIKKELTHIGVDYVEFTRKFEI